MRAVGEVMSIGKTYKEAFQKAIRSLEIGRYGLGWAKDFHEKSKEELLKMLRVPTSERQFILYEPSEKARLWMSSLSLPKSSTIFWSR